MILTVVMSVIFTCPYLTRKCFRLLRGVICLIIILKMSFNASAQCTAWAKKVSHRSPHITSSNTVRFSEFSFTLTFSAVMLLAGKVTAGLAESNGSPPPCSWLLEICNKAIIKYPTSPDWITFWSCFSCIPNHY